MTYENLTLKSLRIFHNSYKLLGSTGHDFSCPKWIKPLDFINKRYIFSSPLFQLKTDLSSGIVCTNQLKLFAREVVKIKEFSPEVLDEILQYVKPLGRQVDETNFNAVFLEVCRSEKLFSLGKEFFHFLHSQKKANLAVMGKFFRLCYDFSSKCSKDDKLFLIELYNELLSIYPVLDSRTCENVALGLGITQEWREGLKLLDMYRLSSSPSALMYSGIIEAAFRNMESDIAYKLLNEMVVSKNPTLKIYETWMESADFSLSAYNEILKFIEKYDIHLTEDIAQFMMDILNKMESRFSNYSFTSIHSNGICKNCRRPLKPLSITDEEFNKLKDAFLNPVLIGKNIFYKTKPEEFSSFISFLKKSGKVDVVLDGLNIAYAKAHGNKLSASKMLSDVVKYFLKQSKKVTVVGRKHMITWPKQYMTFIEKNTNMFLAENVSADDPFILYTAMHSGLGTCFVSRDQMRSHRFLLKNLELNKIFSQWQQKHQYYLKHVASSEEVILAKPVPYLRCAQESQPGVWHIPIITPMDGVPGHLSDSKTKWLCIPSSQTSPISRKM